jgi:adenylate cyclase class 2
MIEVEIRARIDDAGTVKKCLGKIGAKFLKRSKQADRVFGHPRFLDSDRMIVEGGYSARIRETDDKVTLDFKEIARKSGGGIEVSARLSDAEAGLKFLEKLGFEEAFTVAKSREDYSYKDFTISLDDVDRLGRFVEIEKMLGSADDKEKARDECLALLKLLAPNSELTDKKYGDMMQEMINKEKENK